MKKLKQKQQLTQQLQERQKQHQSSALLEANRVFKESLQPQLQSRVNKPSQKIQVPTPTHPRDKLDHLGLQSHP